MTESERMLLVRVTRTVAKLARLASMQPFDGDPQRDSLLTDLNYEAGDIERLARRVEREGER